MTLQLSNSNVQSNYYLTQIKKLDTRINELENQEVVDDDVVVADNVGGIKFIDQSLDVTNSYFNDDVVAYYDFSSEKYVGRDLTGKNNHLDNTKGVKQTVDLDGRKYSVNFDRNNHELYNNTLYENVRVLHNNTKVDDFKMAEWSVSLWFRENVPASETGSIFNFSDTNEVTASGGGGGSYFDIRTKNNELRVIYVTKGGVRLDCKKTVSDNA